MRPSDQCPQATLNFLPGLEARVEAAAQASGKTAQDVIVEAVEAYFAEASEDRASFVSEALAAREEFNRTGLAYDADDVFNYLLERAKGNNAAPPALKQWPA